jgi:hypothetical protein
MNSMVEGTEVFGFTSAYLNVRSLVIGNSNERLWFCWASNFIGTLDQLGLTPVSLKAVPIAQRFQFF